MLVASAMRRTASSLNSVLNFLAFFFAIGLSHYGRYVSPISSRPPCLTFGVHYTKGGGPTSCLVPWTLPAIQAYATETAQEERNHVTFLRGALTIAAVAQPNLDLYNSFNALAIAAGIGASFDPFANDLDFLVGAYIFEDVGVTAYSGAAPLLTVSANLAAAAGILGVEAYHAGLVRTSIFIADPTGKLGLQGYTQQISAARMKFDGSSTVDDIGVGFQTVSVEPATTTNGAATIVDAQTGSTNYSKTYSRSTTQVINIVTGDVNMPASGAKYTGVFFPNGLNGLFS
jgi:Ferritin-like domain